MKPNSPEHSINPRKSDAEVAAQLERISGYLVRRAEKMAERNSGVFDNLSYSGNSPPFRGDVDSFYANGQAGEYEDRPESSVKSYVDFNSEQENSSSGKDSQLTVLNILGKFSDTTETTMSIDKDTGHVRFNVDSEDSKCQVTSTGSKQRKLRKPKHTVDTTVRHVFPIKGRKQKKESKKNLVKGISQIRQGMAVTENHLDKVRNNSRASIARREVSDSMEEIAKLEDSRSKSIARDEDLESRLESENYRLEKAAKDHKEEVDEIAKTPRSKVPEFRI